DPSSGQGGGQTIPAPLQRICLQPMCAAFSTPAMQRPFRISWIPTVRLTVVPTGPGGGLSAYLYSVQGSRWTRIGWGQADLRFPDGGREARPVTPGQPVDVELAIQPLDTVVPAGEQLVLVLSEGNAYNRLPVVPNYPMQIEVGGSSSVLFLWEVNPRPSQYFDPRH
ncbi:MAG TPA: CocE/NonD family hydrolase C-terminal non-catalytic domain-containing protein, partial [Actinomycetota bacterium]|nr:CocE/NonD family hydrolase C-terminal non-catalytic domain-containing protein [Actinomycetota bacterium]